MAAWDTYHGPHMAGPFAQAGDLAMVSFSDAEGGGQSMGICLGNWLAVPGVTELQLLPILRAEATWRV